jgi:hypothetical protein
MKSINKRRTAITLAIGGTAAAAVLGTTLAIHPAGHDAMNHSHGASTTAVVDAAAAEAAEQNFSTQTLTTTASTTASGGDAVYFAAALSGRNEVPVPNGPAVGDKDGAAIEFVRVQGDQVSFAMKWKGIAPPTAAHIHQGVAGQNGDVKIPFFAEKLPGSLYSVTGSVTVSDPELLADLRQDPTGFYANLHTAEFPGGAVRGQLHKVTGPIDFRASLTNFQASVVKGKQIYACTEQSDGTYAFTQNNVSARLGAGIKHFFVNPTAGPPAWLAPDGSAVTGTLIAKTPNGTGNIPELDLKATQAGRSGGLLSRTQEILRLNTLGGVAPAGTCDPRKTPKVGVPYQADYLFLQR